MRLSQVLSARSSWLALALPFAALSWRLQSVADAAGHDVGAALAELAQPLAGLTQSDADALDGAEPATLRSTRRGELDILADVALSPSALADHEQAGQKGARRAKHAARAANVRISAQRVLALAERRALPHAVPVAASGGRPAGLLLRGVSALGLGVRDGDVLTEAAGVPATSAAAVIGAVIAARSRREPEISGRIFRGSEPYVIVVEQPYQLTPSL